MMTDNKILAAAIQLNIVIGDVSANLKSCEDLVKKACSMGATWVALPEFFNTGVSWDPSLAHVIEDELGVSAQLLQTLSEKHGIVLGGSFYVVCPKAVCEIGTCVLTKVNSSADMIKITQPCGKALSMKVGILMIRAS